MSAYEWVTLIFDKTLPDLGLWYALYITQFYKQQYPIGYIQTKKLEIPFIVHNFPFIFFLYFTFIILSPYILICIILFFIHQNLSNNFFYPKSKRLSSFLLLLLSLFFHRCTRRVLKCFFHASVDRKQTRMTYVSIKDDIPPQHLCPPTNYRPHKLPPPLSLPRSQVERWAFLLIIDSNIQYQISPSSSLPPPPRHKKVIMSGRGWAFSECTKHNGVARWVGPRGACPVHVFWPNLSF